jgi:arginine utilization protein RocB
MSSRVLRKLQGDKDLVNDVQNDYSDPESELECAGGAKKKQLNVNRYDVVRQFLFSSYFKCLIYSL